jgi:phosphoenolpyruvate---glycerone phosphotransferase subunit DhaL
MNTTRARRLIEAIAQSVIAHAEELTQLDQAIGDGDHGVNMKRGFEAVLADLDTLAAGDVAALFTGVGRTLVMKVGGASGPLYGTLFMQLGKSWPADLDVATLYTACRASVEAVAARGKSQPGQKTMLDVLFPVCDLLAAGTDRAALRAFAGACAQKTVPMEATRGRASFLKERSIGHLDPGARSTQLMIEAACDSLERV